MKIRPCQHCGNEFDSMPFSKGPPRRYCSSSCRSLATYYRKNHCPADPVRVLQGKIGMAERYGRHAQAEDFRAQLRQLNRENE